MGDEGGNILIYNLQQQRIVKVFRKTSKSRPALPNAINDCIFSSSGKYLAILYQSFVEVFDTKAWNLVAVMSHENIARTCLFLGQDRYLAVGYEVKNYDVYTRTEASKIRKQSVVVWDMQTKKPIKVLQEQNEFDNDVNSLAYYNGKLLCGSGDTDRIREAFNKDFLAIWDLKSEKVTNINKSPIYHKSRINSVIVDKYIITASFDGTIIIHNKNFQPLQQLKGHKSYIYHCCLSPDKKYLVSTSNDNSIIVWSMETFQRVATLVGHIGAVYKCVFYGNNELISSGKDGVKFWSIRYDDKHFTVSNPFVFPPQDYAITNCQIDPRKPQIAFALEYGLSIFLNDFSGNKIVLSGENRQKPFLGSLGPVRFLQFHPQKNIIASSCDIGLAFLWNMQNGQKIRKYSGHKVGKHVRHCVFNKDGTRLASASYDSTVRIWDTDVSDFSAQDEGNALFILEGFTEDVNMACFHPAKSVIIGCGQPGIKMWNIDEAQLRGKKNVKLAPIKSALKSTSEVFYCQYTKDTKYIIIAAKGKKDNLFVVDSETLEVVHTFEGHNDRVEIFSFIPHYPNRLASASYDGTIRIWNLDNIEKSKKSRSVLTIEVSNQHLKTLCFNHDGSIMVCGGLDRHLRLWRFTR